MTLPKELKCKRTENKTRKGLDETHQSACGKKRNKHVKHH